MQRRNYSGIVVLCVLGIVFAGGLLEIFRIRLGEGTLYPAWSSLRSDPDGTRVLFDSLAGTGRFVTVRQYKELKASPEQRATILYLGYSPPALMRASNAELGEFEGAAKADNRIVIAMDPGQWTLPPKAESGDALVKRWGVSVDKVPDEGDEIRLFFGKADGWNSLVVDKGKPVVIERAFGAGSIVLAAASSTFSNQSLALNRDSTLLARLIGGNARVVFDESHLGITDSGSILGLIRRYRMGGLMVGLLVVALMFVWNHAAGFPPPDPAHRQTTSGHDAQTGLGQLLRRQIAARDVVGICVAEWERSGDRRRLALPQPRVRQHGDPLENYRSFQQELTRK